MNRLINKLLQLFKPKTTANQKKIKQAILQDNSAVSTNTLSTGETPKIVLHISQLGPGGAERQLCNCAVGLHKRGYDVTVLTTSPLEGDLGYFLPYLNEYGISARAAEPCTLDMLIGKKTEYPHFNLDVLNAVPDYLSGSVYALVNELLSLKPDVLHCWLDHSNIIGGLAGFISSVPRILLGARNVNPTHFIFYQPWFDEWYKVLIKSRRIVLINNSKAGAEDYAKWLGISPSGFHVIYNGVDFSRFETVSNEDAVAFRHSLGIDDGPLIGGVFRIGPEKRPFDFISVIKKVREEIENIKVVVAGIGTLEKKVKMSIKQNGLGNTIIMLGTRSDIFTVIKACDVILHTSENDGNPNALLEAQYLSVPVVATKAGGTPEVVDDGISGLLHPIGDIDSLADSVIKILQDKSYAKKLGEHGHKHILERFSVDRMVNGILEIYNNVCHQSIGRKELIWDEKCDTYKKSRRFVVFIVVSIYLTCAGLFLFVTRRVKTGIPLKSMINTTVKKYIRKLLKIKVHGVFNTIDYEENNCYVALITDDMISDATGLSNLKVFEDGKLLGPAHSTHDDIRNFGNGRYSHWNKCVYFSTSDNTDPRINGRSYYFSE